MPSPKILKSDQDAAPSLSTGSPLVCVEHYEREAQAQLSRSVHGYYSSGATAETTLKENSKAFNRWYILPRMLRDVSQRSMTTEVLGMQLQMPVVVSPTAMQKMAHPDGECASARAASRLGAVFTLSMASTCSIEEVAQATPDSLKFFQTYLFKDRLVNMDEAFEEYKRKNQSKINSVEYGVFQFVQYNTWDHLKHITKLTSLPVVAKGVLTGDDAQRALDAGVSAVWVSNHGGRQVDGVPPTIEALPHVVAAVAGRCPVFVDGGFTQGTEVFKALALGASLVCVGRPVLWGLACGGEEGVHHVLSIIRDELDNVMANTGCCSTQDIKKNMIVRKEIYSRL